MGMDYIAVYEEEEDDASATAGQIKISTDKVQKPVSYTHLTLPTSDLV